MYAAIVSCLEYCNKISEDIALGNMLQKQNIPNDIVAWNDKAVDWHKYDIAILRSAWGYHKDYANFLKWLDLLDGQNIPLVNDTKIVRWNINKAVQFNTLQELQIPVIPYEITNTINLSELYQKFATQKLVFKPVVSASGNDTYVINSPELKNNMTQKFIKTKFQNTMCLVQPFITNVHNGEYALVFMDGVFSHAVIRFPGIFTDKKQPIYIPKNKIPQNIIDMAVASAKSVQQYFGKNPVYARYDIVNDGIMEIELAEPDLMTRNIPEKQKNTVLKNFAQIISRGYQK